ncbi:MAG: ABC transporter ATP-binding protein [Lachnospiraceae bacterium]|nr:ABC transporter ATP-binding protein [Lachnospiraceae bacterium]
MSEKGSIEIKNLTKVYHLYNNNIDRIKETFSITRKRYSRDHYALKDVNIQINKGESIGLVGTNGSGKSTLLKLVTGVVTPTEGEIFVNGKIAALLELGAGFNPEFTGMENIYLNGTMMGLSENEIKKKVPSIVEFADIGEFIDQPVKSYSSGMFSRLAFAVSINVEPDILIVDEVLSVGDTRFQIKCIDKMKELRDSGTTILFVTHSVEQIKRFCNRSIWIDKGKVIEDGEASKVVDMYDNFMKYGEKIDMETEDVELTEFKVPEHFETPSVIKKVNMNKSMFSTYDKLEVDIIYDIFQEGLEDFQMGVAIYSIDRKQYIFGPNTNLDKMKIDNSVGRHKITYTIPKLMLMSGDYCIDVGSFQGDGIVNLDYKTGAGKFSVTNEYFSEGQFYMEHEWKQ